MINNPNILEQDDIASNSDEYVNIQLELARRQHNNMEYATVKHHITDEDNLPIGQAHTNHIPACTKWSI